VGVFTEGFDEPGVEVVAIMRPTKVRSLYAQMVGRGTRPLPGLVDGVDRAEDRRDAIAASAKPYVHVIDFAGNPGKHKLVTTADILGGNYSEEVVERARKKAAKGSVDMSQAIAEAQQEISKEAEERAKRSSVIGKAEFYRQEVDPFNVFDLTPGRVRGWDVGKFASPKQVALLKTFGIDASKMTVSHASQLIDECMTRRRNGSASFSQAKRLKERGLRTDMSVAEAAIALGDGDRLKAVSDKWRQQYANK
jgi:superfamily II DNA or RNA helicase